MGEKIKFSGEIVQVIEEGQETQIRLAVNGDYNAIIFAIYDSSIVKSRILEDDTITFYGVSTGLITYESTLGGNISIPGAVIDKIEQ